jgi:secretion/DNA translocation related TadE-like protein
MNESGSGSILGLGLIFVVLGIMGLTLVVSSESLEVSRLQAQTDTAALAAEDVLRGLATGYPCETARKIVERVGGRLETCHIVSFDIYISVYSEVMGIVHRVHAHASAG